MRGDTSAPARHAAFTRTFKYENGMGGDVLYRHYDPFGGLSQARSLPIGVLWTLRL
jgi:hypothetical protein